MPLKRRNPKSNGARRFVAVEQKDREVRQQPAVDDQMGLAVAAQRHGLEEVREAHAHPHGPRDRQRVSGEGPAFLVLVALDIVGEDEHAPLADVGGDHAQPVAGASPFLLGEVGRQLPPDVGKRRVGLAKYAVRGLRLGDKYLGGARNALLGRGLCPGKAFTDWLAERDPLHPPPSKTPAELSAGEPPVRRPWPSPVAIQPCAIPRAQATGCPCPSKNVGRWSSNSVGGLAARARCAREG